MDYLFENALRLARKIDPNFQPTKIQSQKRPTSFEITFLKSVAVKLLTGPYSMPIQYTQKGTPRKYQPAPIKPGEIVYARLDADGTIDLYPFSMAGSGYELVKDVEEGVHYEYDPSIPQW